MIRESQKVGGSPEQTMPDVHFPLYFSQILINSLHLKSQLEVGIFCYLKLKASELVYMWVQEWIRFREIIS